MPWAHWSRRKTRFGKKSRVPLQSGFLHGLERARQSWSIAEEFTSASSGDLELDANSVGHSRGARTLGSCGSGKRRPIFLMQNLACARDDRADGLLCRRHRQYSCLAVVLGCNSREMPRRSIKAAK